MIFSLAVITIVVMYLVEIDNPTTNRDLRDFIHASAPCIGNDGLLCRSKAVFLEQDSSQNMSHSQCFMTPS